MDVTLDFSDYEIDYDDNSTENIDEIIKIIKEHFPYMSVITCFNKLYVGAINNSDEKFVSFYDFNSLRTKDEKKIFLKNCDDWYWESNRLLPISIFLNLEMKRFRHVLRSLNLKETTVHYGALISLAKISNKRIKRRQIQLVRP